MKATGNIDLDVCGIHITTATIVPVIIALPALLIYGIVWLICKGIKETFSLFRR